MVSELFCESKTPPRSQGLQGCLTRVVHTDFVKENVARLLLFGIILSLIVVIFNNVDGFAKLDNGTLMNPTTGEVVDEADYTAKLEEGWFALPRNSGNSWCDNGIFLLVIPKDRRCRNMSF